MPHAYFLKPHHHGWNIKCDAKQSPIIRSKEEFKNFVYSTLEHTLPSIAPHDRQPDLDPQYDYHLYPDTMYNSDDDTSDSISSDDAELGTSDDETTEKNVEDKKSTAEDNIPFYPFQIWPFKITNSNAHSEYIKLTIPSSPLLPPTDMEAHPRKRKSNLLHRNAVCHTQQEPSLGISAANSLVLHETFIY